MLRPATEVGTDSTCRMISRTVPKRSPLMRVLPGRVGVPEGGGGGTWYNAALDINWKVQAMLAGRTRKAGLW